jgi:predicted ribosomally synthesized peptide with nif11-like leader
VSIESAKSFVERLKTDEEFAKIVAECKKMGEDATHQKLIDFAKNAGYDITLDEMREFFRNLKETKNGTLTDAELDIVAGGKNAHESSYM